MTHVTLDLDGINWEHFLQAQEGGGSVDATRYFSGQRYQRGFGLLGTVGRFLLPIVKDIATNVAKTAGTEALELGKNVLAESAQGKSVEQAFKTHGKQGLQNIAERLKQCGKGKKRPKKAKRVMVYVPPKRRRRFRDQLSEEESTI
jgi:hypothetical protein